MGFTKVYRSLQDLFPQIDAKVLRAVAIEHSKDADAAVEIVFTEIIPFFNERSRPSTPLIGGEYVGKRSRPSTLVIGSEPIGESSLLLLLHPHFNLWMSHLCFAAGDVKWIRDPMSTSICFCCCCIHASTCGCPICVLQLGMSNGLDTLCGQAYGAKQYHMLGIYLQRSWIIPAISTTLILSIYIFATPILKALGQDEAIAEMAGGIALWFIPVIYSFAVSFSCQTFLQEQSKNVIISYLAAASLTIHIVISRLLTIKY